MTDYPPPPVDETPSTDFQAQPHNREAEEAVLGAVLINSEAFYDVSQQIQPDDFYIVRNRWIWEAFIRLHDQRLPIDYLTVCHEYHLAAQPNAHVVTRRSLRQNYRRTGCAPAHVGGCQ